MRQSDDDDLDNDDFDDDDYQEFIDREFGDQSSTSTPRIWRWTAIGLLILFALFAMLAI